MSVPEETASAETARSDLQIGEPWMALSSRVDDPAENRRQRHLAERVMCAAPERTECGIERFYQLARRGPSMDAVEPRVDARTM